MKSHQAIVGERWPLSNVFGILAIGSSEDEVLKRLKAKSREVLPLAFQQGADLVDRHRLSLPGRAVLTRKKIFSEDCVPLSQAEDWAKGILAELALGRSEEEVLGKREILHPLIIRAVFALVSTLSIDEAWPRAFSQSSDQSVRKLVKPRDLDILSDYYRFLACERQREDVTPEQGYLIWSRLVSQVAEGTKDGLYNNDVSEFKHDLLARDDLEGAITLLSPVSKAAVLEHLRPLDEQFHKETNAMAKSIYGNGFAWPAHRWWWYRIPSRRGPKY